MKDALLGVLQQRMDKCTSEQFWAVGAITGLDAFLLTQAGQIQLYFPSTLVIATVIVLAIYGYYFIASRHVGYFLIYDQLVDLVKHEPYAPKLFKARPKRWKGHNLSGLIFYCAWVTLSSIATVAAYL